MALAITCFFLLCACLVEGKKHPLVGSFLAYGLSLYSWKHGGETIAIFYTLFIGILVSLYLILDEGSEKEQL